MAVQDIKSDLQVISADYAAISSDTTTAGAIIDTANFDLGLMFGVAVYGYTDGTYTLLLEESDDSGMSGSSVVSGDKLIGTLPAVAAADADGDVVETVGVISTKRYVRPSIVSTSVTTGATVQTLCIQKTEVGALS